jgi:amino acid adenylation domain-containing protein
MTGNNDIDAGAVADRGGGLSEAKRALLERRLAGKRVASPQIQAIPRYAGNDPAPLSSAQLRFWILEQLEPNNTAYYIAGLCRLLGPLRADIFHRSLDEVMRRHEALRATFVTRMGEPVQVVAPEPALDLPVEQVDAGDDATWLDAVTRRAHEESCVPIDLEQGPMLRVRLLRRNAHDHALVIVTHHIACDGWSLGVLMRELLTLYRSFVSGQVSPLPVLPIRYADYARWQQTWLCDDRLGPQLAYWQERLRGIRTLDLPTDRPRPPIQTFAGKTYVLVLPADTSAALKAFAQREKVTLFIATLAVFKLLLFRLTHQDDIAVGTPIAGRNRSELEGLVGLFINSLVLRTQMSGEMSFQELLTRVRETALGAYANQDLPFEHLVEVLNPERDRSRNPLYQVMFRFNERFDEELLHLPDMQVVLLPLENDTAQLDLTFSMTDGPRGLTVDINYNTDLFRPSTIERMAGYFVRLAENVMANPQGRVSAFNLLSDDQQRELLTDWNSTDRDFPMEPVSRLFERQAARRPQAPALTFDGASLTYAELNSRANRLARHLQAQGVGTEVRVGVHLERGVDMVMAVLAVLKAGGAYVPLDPAYPAERLTFMLEDSQAAVLLSQAHLLPNLATRGVRVVCLERDAGTIAARSDAPLETTPAADDLAYLIYTSGSTGKPKGVEIPHRALSNFLQSMAREPGMHENDVLLAVTTLSFDIAALELYLPLISGARLVLASRETAADSLALSALLAASGATVMQATPATWQLLLAAGWKGSPALTILCGGEALPRELADALLPRCVALWNLYGPTETTVWSTVYRVEVGSGAIPIGRPIANTRLYILDPAMQPVPVGVAGELHIAGVQVARGYLNRPDLTAERFVPDPYSDDPAARMYKTGDLARYLPDGNIEYLGRLDNQVKLRGFRIELGEIEAVLAREDGVRAAVVTVREDTPGDQRLVAYVVADPEHRPVAEQLRTHAGKQLPAYMVPSTFVFLDMLPLTPSGKIDRKALPVPSRAIERAIENTTAPRGELELAMARIWEKFLEIDGVQATDTFFDLGGHSLLSIKVVERFESETGLRIAPMDLVNQTLRQIITSIENQRTSPVKPPKAGRAGILSGLIGNR